MALSSHDAAADSDGDVPHRTFGKGREASGVVVTEPGRRPAIAELAAAARPSRNLRRECGGRPGPGELRRLRSGRLGLVGRGPATGSSHLTTWVTGVPTRGPTSGRIYLIPYIRRPNQRPHTPAPHPRRRLRSTGRPTPPARRQLS